MDKITDAVSVWDNGETWPLRAPVFFEIRERGATKVVCNRWLFQGSQWEMNCSLKGYFSLDLLPDETGLVAIDGNPGKHAYILNGDGTERFVLTPTFNVRGLSAEKLLEIKEFQKEGLLPNDGEEGVFFHYVNDRSNKLEIFGDDGFGDCYYSYDWNTGRLISARALPHRT